MINMRTFSVAVTAVGLLIAMPAAAALKIARFSGTVTFGFDVTGVFNAPNTDLTGYDWVATYTYDRTIGNSGTDDATYDYSEGYGNSSPIVDSTIMINGVTKHIAGIGAYGLVSTDTSPLIDFRSTFDFDDGVTSVSNFLDMFGSPAGAAASLDQNVSPTTMPGGFGNGEIFHIDAVTGEYVDVAVFVFGSDIVYSVSSAVPEPSTWALMIAGFAMVGTALRRRITRAA